MAINFEKLDFTLQNFVTTTNDIQGAALVSPDGLPIATYLLSDIDEERMSAMSAAMLSLGNQIGVELSTGILEEFYIEGSNGYVILNACSEDAIFLALASKCAQPGRLMLEIKQIITKIKQILISENLSKDLKDFFEEDLIDDLKDLLSENSVNTSMKNVSEFAETGIIKQEYFEEQKVNILAQLTRSVRESVYMKDIFNTIVKELRRTLKVDRVYCYRFNSDWSGVVVAESVAPGWPSCLKIKVTDTYFTQSKDGVDQYKHGRICVNDDIYKAGLADCHLKLLEQFATKAQLIAPILINNNLIALIIANQCSQSRSWEKDEIDLFVQLAKEIGFTLEQANLLEQQEVDAERAHLLFEFTHQVRQALNLEELFKTTVKEVRRIIKTDRVVIVALDNTSWDGTVVAESVAFSWPQILKFKIDDPCFGENHLEMYKNGSVRAIDNIYQEPGLSAYHIKLLEQFGVKANLVAPVLKNKELFGLMIAHQCSAPRTWQRADINLFAQLATQVGLAVEQVNLLEQQEFEAERAQLITEITLRIRQSLSFEDVLKTTVREVRRTLKTERVVILSLDYTNWDGIVVAESVTPGWPQILKFKINDPCFREGHLKMYKNGHVCAIDNIYQEPGLTDSYIKMLEQFGVKANLGAPIMKNEQLLGLMMAHHCSEPRTWQQADIDLFAQLANQVGFAINQASILKQIEQEQAY